VRVLLAAAQCDKSALAGNLAMHVRLLEEAARARCDITVCPEVSLTGSVDPRTHPEDAIEIRDEEVDGLARATGAGVAARFGIAERSDGTPGTTRSGSPSRRRQAAPETRSLRDSQPWCLPTARSWHACPIGSPER
jgi:predicted amidohydrolase